MPCNQNINFVAYENVNITCSMSPLTNIGTFTLQMNIRSASGSLLLTLTNPTIVNSAAGVFVFVLSSNQTGVTLGAGNFLFDIWNTTSGSEAQLVSGSIYVASQEWK